MPAPTKNTKKTASKAKVGTGKQASSWRAKLPKSKWKLGYLAATGFLFLTASAYTATGVYQTRQAKAKAAGYTYMGTTSYGATKVTFYACKSGPINGGIYGSFWKVNTLAFRGSSQVQTIRARVSSMQAGYGENTISNSGWLYGTMNGIGIYAPTAGDYQIGIFATSSTGQNLGGQTTFIRSLNYC